MIPNASSGGCLSAAAFLVSQVPPSTSVGVLDTAKVRPKLLDQLLIKSLMEAYCRTTLTLRAISSCSVSHCLQIYKIHRRHRPTLLRAVHMRTQGYIWIHSRRLRETERIDCSALSTRGFSQNCILVLVLQILACSPESFPLDARGRHQDKDQSLVHHS